MVQPCPSRPRRLMSAAGRSLVTLLTVGAAIGIGVAGHGLLASRAAAVPSAVTLPPTPVSLAQLELQSGHVVTRRFAGQFEAPQQIDLSFELGGTLAEVRVEEGDRLRRGDLVARTDVRALSAERARAEAMRAAASAELELALRTNARQEDLRARGFATDQRVDDTSLTVARLEARLAEADAALTAIDVSLSKAALRAPFDGIVGDRLRDVGAFATAGAPVVTLLQEGAMRFRVGLDPALASKMSVGQIAQIRTGQGTFEARLSHLGPDLDPMTRSRTALYTLTDAGVALPTGATGEVVLSETLSEVGAWVPLTALRQGPSGSWTLLTVVDGRVFVEAAEVLNMDDARAFIRGTFSDGVSYLPEGVHRVVPGQEVEPVTEAVTWAR